MNIDSLKEEARRILISHGNKTWYYGALGKAEYAKLSKDNRRLNYLFGVLDNIFIPYKDAALTYGHLYNFYALTGIAPTGWHVPTYAEWQTLATTLGGESIAGGKMKTADWDSPNTGATNSSGFSALPAAERLDSSSANDGFLELGQYAIFWTSTTYDADTSIDVTINYNSAVLWLSDTGGYSNGEGKSVRLIKDNDTDPLTLTDIDGNVYPTVKIGDQVWMAENLRVTRLADGTPIPNVTDYNIWSQLSTGAYCIYNLGYFLGDTEVTSDFVLSAIENIRHYNGLTYDLSAIGSSASPSTPASDTSSLIRAGSQAVTPGAASITFSSALTTTNYTVNVWVIGTGESQFDLGTITKAMNGFTCSDILISGTLYYQVIVNV